MQRILTFLAIIFITIIVGFFISVMIIDYMNKKDPFDWFKSANKGIKKFLKEREEINQAIDTASKNVDPKKRIEAIKKIHPYLYPLYHSSAELFLKSAVLFQGQPELKEEGIFWLWER